MRFRRMTAEERRKVAEATRIAMADPAVRQRISERTKAGMRRASAEAQQLEAIRAAWSAAGRQARRRFMLEIVDRCLGPADGGKP